MLAPGGAAGDAHGGVVLLRAVDVVREILVERHAVELRGGLIVHGAPGAPAVARDGGAAVVALDHAVRIVGRDPQVVIVAVRRAKVAERAAAVDRTVNAHIERVDRVGILRVGEDVRVIPGALPQDVLIVHLGPVAPAIVGAEQAAVGGLHQRPHALRIGRRDGDADAAEHAARQPGRVRDLGPGVAAVGALEQPAARSAAIHAPGLAADLPHRRVEHARIARVHRDIHRARGVAALQHLLPGGAAIGGAVDAAHFVGPPQVPERRHVDDVGILRMHAHRADVVAVLEADIAPGAAGIHALVDAVAVRRVAAHAGFAHAGVDDIGVGIGHRQRAHRAGLELAVGDRKPGQPAIGGLEHAAAHRAEVVGVGLRGNAGHRHRAAAAERSDLAEFQFLQEVGLLRGQQQRKQNQGCESQGLHSLES